MNNTRNMARNNMILIICIICILLPRSSSIPPSRKLAALKGRGGFFKALFQNGRRVAKKTDDIPTNGGSDKNGKSSKSITYSYIDITINGPYSNAFWDMDGDFIWTNCEPSRQEYTIYDRYKSSTFSELYCTDPLCPRDWNSLCPSCSYSYTDEYLNSTEITLARDYMFTLGNLVLSDIIFWCGTKNNGVFDTTSGVIGLGWEENSLVAQMGHGKFSYCLNSNDSNISPLFLVSEQPNLQGNLVQSTTLVKNFQNPSAYYVNLIGISVGGQPLTFPSRTFSLQSDGSGGVVLDSGYFVTFLPNQVYQKVKVALRSNVSLSQADGSAIGLDLCFLASNPNRLPALPEITLHFAGQADMVLDPYNYMVIDEARSLLCLAMLPSTVLQSDDGISILGYLLQTDKHMFFNLNNSMLSFKKADCASSMTQYLSGSSSNLHFHVGLGFYYQILAGFMFYYAFAGLKF